MDFSETVENDPFVNAGKARAGLNPLSILQVIREHFAIYFLESSSHSCWRQCLDSESRSFRCMNSVSADSFWAKNVCLRPWRVRLAMAEAMIEIPKRISSKWWVNDKSFIGFYARRGAETKRLLLQQGERPLDGAWSGGDKSCTTKASSRCYESLKLFWGASARGYLGIRSYDWQEDHQGPPKHVFPEFCQITLYEISSGCGSTATSNGWTPNGWTPDGWTTNGWTPHGWTTNGRATNGWATYGRTSRWPTNGWLRRWRCSKQKLLMSSSLHFFLLLQVIHTAEPRWVGTLQRRRFMQCRPAWSMDLNSSKLWQLKACNWNNDKDTNALCKVTLNDFSPNRNFDRFWILKGSLSPPAMPWQVNPLAPAMGVPQASGRSLDWGGNGFETFSYSLVRCRTLCILVVLGSCWFTGIVISSYAQWRSDRKKEEDQ